MQMFQRLNYGVVFQQKSQVYIAQDFWYHTFEIELPNSLTVPRLASCRKNNSTCHMISHFLAQLDSIRAETAARLNETKRSAQKLIPETRVHKSRSKRSLLPFLGKLSRGLFGTATVDDVNILADHMNKLNKMASGLAKALTQHEDHLSSFIQAANSRMDNLMSGIKQNNLAIKFIQNELHTTARNLEGSFDYMMGLLIDQVKTSSALNHELEEFKVGIIGLVNGRLSPLLIPQHVMYKTLQDIQMMLQTKFNGFHLTLKSVNEIYSECKYLYARNNTRIYVTVQLPISHFKDPLTLYKVISVPVPINSTSTHATQLLNLPNNFIITANKQYYAGISNFDLSVCTGNQVRYCQSNIALSPVTSASCILALFGNDKSQVKALCDFRFLQAVLKPEIIELSPNSLLIYRTPLISLECLNDHKMATGCDFCLFKLPCRCSISTNNYYLAPRLASCHRDNDNVTTLHPVNLALLQHFFDDKFVDDIFADTTFNKPVNVTIPKIKIYQHEMSNIVAADTKAHLSLTKMAETAKKDAVIFQSLTEPLLGGQIQLDTDWPSTDNIIQYITSSATIILSVLLGWTIFKLRKLTAALLVVQKVQECKSMATDIPSFIYDKPIDVLEKDSTYSSSINFTWEHAYFSLLVTLCVIMVIFLWKHYQLKCKSKLFLEITCGQKCVLLEVMQLPMCPTYYSIQIPTSISDLEIKGPWYSPKLHVSWPEFTITNSLTDQLTHVKSEIKISLLTAIKLRYILSKPFFVYLYKQHYGVMIPIRHS